MRADTAGRSTLFMLTPVHDITLLTTCSLIVSTRSNSRIHKGRHFPSLLGGVSPLEVAAKHGRALVPMDTILLWLSKTSSQARSKNGYRMKKIRCPPHICMYTSIAPCTCWPAIGIIRAIDDDLRHDLGLALIRCKMFDRFRHLRTW